MESLYSPMPGDIIRHKGIVGDSVGVVGYFPVDLGNGESTTAFFQDNQYIIFARDYNKIEPKDLSEEDLEVLRDIFSKAKIQNFIKEEMPYWHLLYPEETLMNNAQNDLNVAVNANTLEDSKQSNQGDKNPLEMVELLTNGIADVEYTPAVIKFDVEKYVERTKEIVAGLEGYVVTEENMAESKTHAANLNKFMKAINDTAVAIDKAASVNITAFRDSAKELIAIIKPVHSAIDIQVKNFDAVQKRKKQEDVEKYIAARLKQVPELRANHAAKLTVLPEYLNKSTSITKIKESIEQRLIQILADQKNEDLALELEEQKKNERVVIIENLNAAYNGKLPTPISYADPRIKSIPNNELQGFFERVSGEYTKELERRQQEKESQAIARQERIPSQTNFETTQQAPVIEDRTFRIKGKNLDKLVEKLVSLGFQIQEVRG